MDGRTTIFAPCNTIREWAQDFMASSIKHEVKMDGHAERKKRASFETGWTLLTWSRRQWNEEEEEKKEMAKFYMYLCWTRNLHQDPVGTETQTHAGRKLASSHCPRHWPPDIRTTCLCYWLQNKPALHGQFAALQEHMQDIRNYVKQTKTNFEVPFQWIHAQWSHNKKAFHHYKENTHSHHSQLLQINKFW